MSANILQIGNIRSIFDSVVDAFSGSYSTKSTTEFDEMKSDFLNEVIPSIGEDRQNLKKDASSVVADYRKAFDVKKAEMSK